MQWFIKTSSKKKNKEATQKAFSSYFCVYLCYRWIKIICVFLRYLRDIPI